MDHSKPLVSVVIPVYNGERYLAEAIQSVLDQTYRNFEVIVVDDGSTDGSASVVKRYGETIRYIHQSNGGVCKSRNTGIAVAQGDYLAFLDQDDLWLPGKLAVQVAYLDSHPEVGAVYSQCEVKGKGWLRSSLYYAMPVKDDIFGIMSGTCLLMTASMIRREVLRKIGGFDEALIGAGAEDIDLTIRLTQVAKIAYLPQILAVYRVHATNNSMNSERLLHNQGHYLRKCQELYGHDSQVARFLDRQMVGYLSNLGKLQIKAGQPAEGRDSLRRAIRLSLQKRANVKMFMRSIGRIVRSYFPI
jgi:glycosyltransferase involved in cell wall biosynthesis